MQDSKGGNLLIAKISNVGWVLHSHPTILKCHTLYTCLNNTFHFEMHISIIKGVKPGSTNLQTHKDQKEIEGCLHIQNTKQVTIINVFNKLAAVAADASKGWQICGPKPDSFYNGNVHYKMEGVKLCHTLYTCLNAGYE